jgi:asparagine synthase (glutamine-hydrolysing)
MDFVEEMKSTLDESVGSRIRDADKSGFSVSLSGGLDSGVVGITAATQLRAHRVAGFVAVPQFPIDLSDRYITNEGFLAAASASSVDNIDLQSLACHELSPVSAIRDFVVHHRAPSTNPANRFWATGILSAARQSESVVLLNGQAGNYGFSWHGSQRLGLRSRVGLEAPAFARRRNLSHAADAAVRRAPINDRFACRIGLREILASELQEARSFHRTHGERKRRFEMARQGSNATGALLHEASARFGIETRDPLADVRLLELAFSMPESSFTDQNTGLDRLLARAVSENLLPDMVRLNRKRGVQSADIVPRLRASRLELEDTLSELALGPSRDYLDIEQLTDAWNLVQHESGWSAMITAKRTLLLGISVGLFINAVASGIA